MNSLGDENVFFRRLESLLLGGIRRYGMIDFGDLVGEEIDLFE